MHKESNLGCDLGGVERVELAVATGSHDLFPGE